MPFEWGESIERETQRNILVIGEVPVGKCLAVHGHLLFAELPIKCTVEDVGNLLGVPCLAILVSIADFFRSGLVEEECDEARYNR